MNDEHPYHKTGLIGEYLVKIKLNDYGINTGSVDKDTGTDIVMFRGERILTAQVKSGYQNWNYDVVHGVHVHFRVNLNSEGGDLLLNDASVRWRRIDVPNSEFQDLTHESINEMFT